MRARWSHLERTIVSFFVFTLLYSRQVGALTEGNRYYLHWELTDGLVTIAAISILSLTAVAISIFLEARRQVFATRLFNHAFVLALMIALLAFQTFKERRSGWVQLLLLIAVGIVGYSLGNERSRLVSLAKKTCLLFSPYVLVVFFMLLTFGRWGPNEESRAPADDVAGGTPIFFFVFDGWSYSHLLEDGELSPSFPHLARLAADSFFFQDARSPSRGTRISVPAMIYQVDVESVPGEELWVDGDRFVPRTEMKSLFEKSRLSGYRTALVGYYFPYCRLLGEQLDRCLSSPHVPKGDSPVEKLAVSLVRNLHYYPDPVSLRAGNLLYSYFYSRNWFRLHQRNLEESLRLIEAGPGALFAFLHFSIPHRPYVFEADGTFSWRFEPRHRRGPSTPEGYRRTLRYVDAVIGQLTSQLRAAGRYADAMIVMTADHGLDDVLVPLVVKLPGQQRGYRVAGRFGNHELGPVIESVLRGAADPGLWRAELAGRRGLEVVAAAGGGPGL